MSTGPSHFISSLSRDLSHAHRLLSSPFGGAAGCVFNVFGGLIVAWVRHLCSPPFLIDEFKSVQESSTLLLRQKRAPLRTVPADCRSFRRSSTMTQVP